MAESGPSKAEINAIFKRLKAIPANKVNYYTCCAQMSDEFVRIYRMKYVQNNVFAHVIDCLHIRCAYASKSTHRL